MRKTLLIGLSTAGLLLTMATTRSFGDDKAVTLTGEGKCAKCGLKEAEKCQNVIQVTEAGKTTTYYLAKNDLSDKFHKNVCTATKKVTAKGTVKEVDGKKQLTVSDIKLAD